VINPVTFEQRTQFVDWKMAIMGNDFGTCFSFPYFLNNPLGIWVAFGIARGHFWECSYLQIL